MTSTPQNPDPRGSDSGSSGLDPEELLSHSTWLRRFARALVHDDASADDLVQDAFGAAIAAPNPIRDLRAFLGGVVRRRSMDVRRRGVRRRRREEAAADDRPRSVPAVDDAAARVETMRIVLEELERLPSAQRDAVTLRFVDGWTAAEIARSSGLAQSSVRSNLARGLAALRERLDQRCGGRTSWCAALAPWTGTPGPGADATPPSSATSASPGDPTKPAGLFGAATFQGVLLMLAQPLAVLLAALALFLTWMLPDAAVDLDAPNARPNAIEVADAGPDALAPFDTGRAAIAPPSAVDEALDESPAAVADVPMVGIIVDALTGEPVPAMDVEVLPLNADEARLLRRSGVIDEDAAIGAPIDVERVLASPSLLVAFRLASPRITASTTDERGRVTFNGLEDLDSIVVAEQDEHGSIDIGYPRVGWHAFEDGAPILVRVGPTFRLDVEIPDDVSRESVVARLEGPGTVPFYEREAALRDGELPWIRFQPAVTTLAGDGPWTVQLSTEDGLWIAEAETRRTRGIEPEPLRFRARRTGAIHFVVSLEIGAPASTRTLRLESVDGDHVETVYFDADEPGETSVGRARFLAPGSYRWTRGALRGRVDVAAGEIARVEIEERYDGPTFDAEVLVDATDVPGLDLDDLWFRIVDPREMTEGFVREIERDGTGGPDGWRVELSGLPARAWHVVPMGTRGRATWDPGFVTIRPGEEAPMLVAAPRGPRIDLRLNVTDADTGGRVAGVEAAVDGGGTMDVSLFRSDEPGVIVAEDVSAGGESLVFVAADGYRTRALRVAPKSDGTRLDVALERGFRAPLRVMRCDDLAYAEGIEVVADGRSLGRTDASGIVWVEGEGLPKEFGLGASETDLEIVRAPRRSDGAHLLVGMSLVVRSR